ncbi:MAG: SoxR reducing system RseC family protein [Bacteroidales bacterium]|nr:SoxR reducing system RseC family protein [Bacteroidales bacterium]
MASDTIIHPGVIDHIEGDKAFVKILSQSACGSCHAKGMCTVAEVEEKIVEVGINPGAAHKEGDAVMVRMDESLGRKAVWMGYGLPFIILMSSIVIFLSVLNNEGLAALLSIAMLAPYYLVLYLMRGRLHKEFRFRID